MLGDHGELTLSYSPETELIDRVLTLFDTTHRHRLLPFLGDAGGHCETLKRGRSTSEDDRLAKIGGGLPSACPWTLSES